MLIDWSPWVTNKYDHFFIIYFNKFCLKFYIFYILSNQFFKIKTQNIWFVFKKERFYLKKIQSKCTVNFCEFSNKICYFKSGWIFTSNSIFLFEILPFIKNRLIWKENQSRMFLKLIRFTNSNLTKRFNKKKIIYQFVVLENEKI